MKIKQAARENPLMAGLISLSTVVAAAMVVWQGVGFVDTAIMSEAEARVIHDGYDQALSDVGKQIEEQSVLSECRWLSDKIDAIEYEIYVLTRDKASSDFIRSKGTTLKKHRDKYDVMRCVTKL